MAGSWLGRSPRLLNLLVALWLGGSAGLVWIVPRSVLAFLLFEAALVGIWALPLGPRARWSWTAVALGAVLPTLGTHNGFYLELALQVGIYVALALGLNIVVGLAGLLDLGYVAFFAVGAYTWAVFGSPQAAKFLPVALAGAFPLGGGWFFVFLALGVIVAAVSGVLLGLPVLRLRGDYLAIVTLGFGEVIRVLANNLDKPWNVTNGPKGITPIGRPPLFFEPWLRALGIEASPFTLYPIYFYALVLGIVGVVILVNRRLERSHIGRAWEAIREDETAAQAMGVPLVRMKLLAFATGASFAGVMGVIFSAKQLFINPESFGLLESIGVLAMVILGGMGSIPGAIIGASLVTILNLQVLKGFSLWLNEVRNAGVEVFGFSMASIPSQFDPAKYERLVFGVILVLMMIYRPKGIVPARRESIGVRTAGGAGAA